MYHHCLFRFPTGSGPIKNIITEIECSPSASQLIDCDNFLNGSCSHSDNVAIMCSSQGMYVRWLGTYIIDQSGHTLVLTTVESTVSISVIQKCAANLRLRSSDGIRTTLLSAGRLEIRIDNQWGTVCSSGFDITDANVACRQLGYSEAVSYSTALDLRLDIWLL